MITPIFLFNDRKSAAHIRRPLVIAHRGASGLAPENTLAAFRLAVALGVDGVELDVHLSADGQPVVIHDSRVNRTTNGAGSVSSLTVDRLRSLDAGSWFERRLIMRPRLRLMARRVSAELGAAAGAIQGEPVPTLEDVLAILAPAGLERIYIELKGRRTNKEPLLEAVLFLVRRFQIESLVTLLSFDHAILHRARQIAADIRTAATFPASGRRLISTRSIIRSAEKAAVDEVALHFGLATRRTVAAMHERGFSVSTWTVNNKLAMRRLASSGVDAIMTNFPNRLREVLESPPRRVAGLGRRSPVSGGQPADKMMRSASAFDEIHPAVSAAEQKQLPQSAALKEIQKFVSRPQFTIRHTSTAACEFQSHSHSAFTVTAVLAGQMTATIGERTFELSMGEAALTGVGQSHWARASEVEFLSVGVSPALVNELVAEIGLIRTTADIVFRETSVTDETIMRMAHAVAAEIADDRLGHEAMLDSIVRQLVIHLLRCHLTVRKSAEIELSRAGPVDRRLRRAIEFMHDNFDRELALEEIAAAAYLSEYYFARLFKQITGLTPHVYLANLRLERARKLLAETALSISEIAATVGYQSQSHFTKVFKSVTGVTPRAYREATK